jgi:voltage-gated potassium channel
MANLSPPEKETLDRERLEVLEQIEEWLETPMLALGFAWLVLLVVELIWGLSPMLEAAFTVIWIIFIVDFAVRFFLAPSKLTYLRRNWLTTIALAVPALRVFRVVRIVRLLQLTKATRSLRLVQIVGSLNRGMRALKGTMSRHGFGYVLALTLIVMLVGAAGMYAFERTEPRPTLASYSDALWLSVLLITTLGPDISPQTGEGRILAFLMAVYGFAVFGYVTATLATFFIGREAADPRTEVPDAQSIAALRAELSALRREVQALNREKPDA